jgi:hypothetical protein
MAMEAIKAITNCNGCNQRHHCETPKRSREDTLHKAALPTNLTRASWERHEYHEDTHPATTIIITGASNTVTQAGQMQNKKRHSTQITADRLGKIMPQISRDEHDFNNKTYKKDFASKTKQKRSRRDTYATRHTQGSLDKPWPDLPGRAADDRP